MNQFNNQNSEYNVTQNNPLVINNGIMQLKAINNLYYQEYWKTKRDMGKTLSQIDGSSELKSKIGRSLSKESRKTSPKIIRSKRLMNYDSSKQMQGSVEPTNIIIDTSLCQPQGSDKSSVERKSNKRSRNIICNTTKNSMIKSVNSKMSKSSKKNVKKESS